jgi:hypothetical protein
MSATLIELLPFRLTLIIRPVIVPAGTQHSVELGTHDLAAIIRQCKSSTLVYEVAGKLCQARQSRQVCA